MQVINMAVQGLYLIEGELSGRLRKIVAGGVDAKCYTELPVGFKDVLRSEAVRFIGIGLPVDMNLQGKVAWDRSRSGHRE